MQAIRLAICADYCYGSRAVEITRKYLDSGPLAEELKPYFGDGCWNANDVHKLLTLCASVMTLGCTLPAKVVDNLKRMTELPYQKLTESKGTPAFRTTTARAQMKKAIHNYKPGTPYDFGNKTMYEMMNVGSVPGATSKSAGRRRSEVCPRRTTASPDSRTSCTRLRW